MHKSQCDAKIRVRRATEADCEAITALLSELGYPADKDDVLMRLQRLNSSPDDEVLVIETGGQVEGLSAVHVSSMLHLHQPVARLTTLVVAEGARGRSHGSRLIDAAALFAKAKGCSTLEVTTGLERNRARKFYEANAFIATSTRLAKCLSDSPER